MPEGAALISVTTASQGLMQDLAQISVGAVSNSQVHGRSGQAILALGARSHQGAVREHRALVFMELP